ncbi:hypothetical protein [Chitinibacter sp. S2-10]|uniref:hypothetical protein n=1 Tax=Chitinibacter sp. S2-10 TaxID=3373597 RepID=UPI00397749D8
MSQATGKAAGMVAIPRPPKFLKTKRARQIWSYLLAALDQAKLDYRSSLTGIALLSEKVDSWRTHADALAVIGERYEEDRNGGSLEYDESIAERRMRVEILRDLDEFGLTGLSVARIRVVDALSNQADLFSPFELADQLAHGDGDELLMPDPPPWTMRPKEKKVWKEILPLLDGSGFDYSTAGLSLGLLASAIADWQDCQDWIADHKGRVFVASEDTGRTYEVSASYNRSKIAKQIRDLLKKNGMTVAACAKQKAISKGRTISPELAELLGFINERPD